MRAGLHFVVFLGLLASLLLQLTGTDHSHIPAQLQPRRPLPVLLINLVGGFLRSVGLGGAVMLPTDDGDVETIVEAACAAVGLSVNSSCGLDLDDYLTGIPPKGLDDWGAADWREGLKQLLSSAKQH